MTFPQIAVVIVNWNKAENVLNLLTQLQEIPEPEFDIFVVDNASTDDSVESIKKNFSNLTLIVNDENKGGTGGFNSGIRYACQKNKYKFIWLLDNDAEITPSTLSELYVTMKADEKIGLAGSRVVDIENKNITVETGANFRWDFIGVIPVNANAIGLPAKKLIIEVDYVAICSALVSVNAIKNVGFMDERLFLFWDDMDWGLCFKKNGYKVVSISSSVAYHGSFSEKERGSVTNFYYGIRNPLLVYAKHASFWNRMRVFYRSLKYFYRNYFFLKFFGCSSESRMIKQAINDYLQNRWGKYSPKILSITDNQTIGSINDRLEQNHSKKSSSILLSLVGCSFFQSKMMIESIKKLFPGSDLTILVHDHRATYFRQYQVYSLKKQSTHNLLYFLKAFIDIKKKFNIIASMTPSPFSSAVKRSILLNKKGQVIFDMDFKHQVLFFQVLAISAAELKTFLNFPLILLKSFRYKNDTIND